MDIAAFVLPLLIAGTVILYKVNQGTLVISHQAFALWCAVAVGYTVLCTVVTFAIGRRLAKSIAFPLRDLKDAAGQMALGDPDVVIDYHARDEIGQLAEAMRQLVAATREEAEILTRISDGQFTDQVAARGDNDVLAKAIAGIIANHNLFIREIKNSILQISAAANEIANGAQNLASGSNEQAATVEEFSAVLGEVQGAAASNASTSDATLVSVREHTRILGLNIEDMAHMTQAMESITESSKRIAKVIKIIDDIAFQTNILSLNAAVEAARAGQHGRGFAVVADEVRELAARSAAAAKETAALIDHSLMNVQGGNALMEKTNESIRQMEAISGEVRANIERMSEASAGQSEAIREINLGIAQISNVIQANSAMAEQSAAAAETMAAQTERLKGLIERFRLLNE